MRFAVGILSFLLLVGCASNPEKPKPERVGGDPIGQTGGKENENVIMNVREAQDTAHRSIELLGLFSSNDPHDWTRARNELRIIGKPFVPDDVEALMRVTEGTDANKAALARLELAKRGKIARVLQKLDSRKFEDWEAARFEISRMGGDSMPYLISALIMEFRSLKTMRYEWARKELIAIGDSAVPYLDGFLLANSTDVVLKDQVAVTLCAMGAKGRASLEHGVASPDKWTRVAVAKSIALANAPEHTDLVCRILSKDDAWEARAEAAVALDKLKAAEGIPLLIQSLKDPDNLVRRESAQALGALKAREAVPALIDVLEHDSGTRFAEVSNASLQAITGQKLGSDPGPWRSYWSSQGGR